ncbi:hypothetical protein M3Y94_01311400 [Aphelenchoides besseyi]|nr:hypothetical protein M3Y94_01311400 [Aphelenchoides besseyi]KAI6220276.1 hypothetical protein M3Y95_01067900 [Aphelenchoides besseyi]
MHDESNSTSEEENCGRGANNFNPDPHLIVIVKTATGFGFNVKGQVSEGGQLRSLNGVLYAPLQHVSAVLRNGAAEKAGLLRGDRILQVNGVAVEGSTHRQVVELIRQGGDRLELMVISVGAEMLEDEMFADESMPSFKYDYTDKRSLPITIPSFQNVDSPNERFIVYNIHMAGRHLGSRRYSEFVQLNKILKEEFPDFSFPKLPRKWPFRLTDQQIDSRRRMLETYLEKVCTVKVLADCDIMQDFLMEDTQPSSCAVDHSIRVLLPNNKAIPLTVKRSSDTATVFAMLIDKLGLSKEAAQFCGLFEIIDTNFERKLSIRECPHNVYIQNYSSAASSCLMLRKWCFNVETERKLCAKDSVFKKLCFYQAVNDVNSGAIQIKERMYQLKALQTEERCDEYLDALRPLDGYSEARFPTAEFSTKNKSGLILINADFNRLNLHLKFAQSEKEKNVEVEWTLMAEYSLSADQTSMLIRIRKNDQVDDLIVASEYAEYLFEVFGRIKHEREAAENGADEVSDFSDVALDS